MESIKQKTIPITSIGEAIINLLLHEIAPGERMSNERIAGTIREQVPGSKTSAACVAWYVSHLRNPNFRKKHGIAEKDYVVLKAPRAKITIDLKVPVSK